MRFQTIALPTVFGLIAVLGSGCAHFRTPKENVATGVAVSSPEVGAPPQENSDLADSGSDLEAIPIEVNRLVLKWIDYFQGPGRPHMERYLSRLTRYAPLMKSVLRREGLPEDLIYIALIESGFNATAHSSASAVGYWQFIRATGRRYGLRVDSLVDERRDFLKSTVAAADYFKGLYNLFGAWYLAIASYNVGENRVKSVVMKYHSRDFWRLARENKLPQETIHYVPKFLAARLIGKAPEKYGFTDIDYQAPLEFDEVEFARSIDLRKLATALAVEYDDLRELNPAYKRGIAPVPASGPFAGRLVLRVPKGARDRASLAMSQASVGKIKVYGSDEDYSYYRVRRGDTLSSIARKFDTNPRVLMQLNQLSARSLLSVHQRIRVPGETVATLGPRHVPEGSRRDGNSKSTEKGTGPAAVEPSKAQGPSSARESLRIERAARVAHRLGSRDHSARLWAVKGRGAKAPAQRVARVHIVRRGENLSHIARRYEVSLNSLISTNHLVRASHVTPGRRLLIPREK